jgi:uncharacterized damage-inducible protein DinB
MKTEIERVLEQVRRSYGGDAWHGPSVSEALHDVDAAMATLRATPGTHTIAELVAHLEFTQQVVLERLEGRGRLTSDEESWPTVLHPLSDAEWSALQRRLRDGASALESAISAFPPARLDAPLVEGGSSASKNLLGHAQHNAYHAGQIMLIKKLVQTR